MNKIDKPKFEFSVFDKTATFFGVLVSVFSFYATDIKISIIMLLSTLLIVLIYSTYRYHKIVEKSYISYLDFFNKFNELENRYNMRLSEIKNKNALIEEYETFIKSLNLFIVSASAKNSATENKKLKTLQEFILLADEHMYKLKGEI